MTTAIEAARYYLVDTPKQLPGCCFFCKTDKGPFIDTGVSRPQIGKMYICSSCLSEMFSKLPVEEPEPEPQPEAISREEFERTVNELRDSLASAVDGLSSYLSNTASVVIPDSDSEDERESDSTDERTTKSAKQTKRTGSKQGSSGVSSDSSDGAGESEGILLGGEFKL